MLLSKKLTYLSLIGLFSAAGLGAMAKPENVMEIETFNPSKHLEVAPLVIQNWDQLVSDPEHKLNQNEFLNTLIGPSNAPESYEIKWREVLKVDGKFKAFMTSYFFPINEESIKNAANEDDRKEMSVKRGYIELLTTVWATDKQEYFYKNILLGNALNRFGQYDAAVVINFEKINDQKAVRFMDAWNFKEQKRGNYMIKFRLPITK